MEVRAWSSKGGATALEEGGGARLQAESARGLQLGSADPHMLREPGEVVEPWVRANNVFSINRLDPADGEELRMRAFPVLNPVPRTDARREEDRGKGEAREAPIAARVEQVVPLETLKRIGRWHARVRASLKAASRGSHRLASMLRPPDLELACERHTEEGAKGWVWDLRPLARGECAVPIASSSLDSPPLTDLRLDRIADLAEGYADQEIIREMIVGFSDDAVGVESHSVLSPPHLGALKYIAQAKEKIAQDVRMGWSQVEASLPFWPIRSNPYSIVREEREARVKYRMTVDLSWPQPSSGGEAVSVNDSIDRERWVQVKLMKISQLAEAVGILMTAGVPVLLWAFDCQAYYRKTGRQRGEVWRNCVVTSEGFVVDEREQFGDASAAVKCCRQSSFLAWLVAKALRQVDIQFPPRDERVREWLKGRRRERQGAAAGESEVGVCGIYVDDGGGASIDDALYDVEGAAVVKAGPDARGHEGAHRGASMRRAEAHFAAAVRAVNETGHSSEVSKEVPPCAKAVVLGMELDVEGKGRMRLSAWMRVRYAERASSVRALKVCGGDEFESLLHRLLFAACAMPMGRQFLNPLFRVARAQFRLAGGRVCVTTGISLCLLSSW